MPLQRFHFSTCACVVDAEYPEKRALKAHSSCGEHASEDPQAVFDAAWELNQQFSRDANAFLATVPEGEKEEDGAPKFQMKAERSGKRFVFSKGSDVPAEAAETVAEKPVGEESVKP